MEDFSPNLVLLDVMMPGVDGFTTLAQIRTKSDIPVIMLTARDQIEDKVKGFELGADD
ncbi:response regulator [uncultured Sutterella sp.]|uniref:response regulator n=1 Tax=uncultured Sutterella sp. TaxID=286133 RepID=UPI0034C68D9B